MKRNNFLMSILLIIVLCTGCHQQADIEKRNYVMGLGIDWADNQYVFTFSFPDLEALVGTGVSIHYPVVSTTGESLLDASESYARQSNRRLDYGQLQSIVIGRKLLENQEKMEEVLNEVKGNRDFSRTILTCMADQNAYDIIELDETVNGSIGIYIRDMFKNNLVNLPYEEVTIGDLMIGLSNPLKEVGIPCVAIDETGIIPEIIGDEIIKGVSLANLGKIR